MNPVLLICCILEALFLVWMIVGLAIRKSNVYSPAIFFLVANLIMGFGLLCAACPVGQRTSVKVRPDAIVRTETATIIQRGETILHDFSVELYKIADDGIFIEYTSSHNAYGGILESSTRIVYDPTYRRPLEKKD